MDKYGDYPTVTIVVPAFNHARYLSKAMESLFAQDYPNLEIIAIDDGSSDSTWTILEQYRKRANVLRQDNVGQSATLNKGWSLGMGEVLSYLSADDVLHPGAVTKCVQTLLKNPLSVCAYPDFALIDPDSRFIRSVRAPDYVYEDMVVRLVCPPGPGAFFWRWAYEVAGEWNPALRQTPDFEFWLRMGLLGSFTRVPETLASFRVHDKSQSFGMVSEARAREIWAVVSEYFERDDLELGIRRRKNEALSNACILEARFHLRAGRVCRGVVLLLKALELWPRNALSLRTLRLISNGLWNRPAHRISWTIRRVLERL